MTVTPVVSLDWRGTDSDQVAWVVEGAGTRLIHCGDTMWHGNWWQIARDHGPFDLAFLPVNGVIAKFEGFEANVPVTLSPEQAVEAALVLGAPAACAIPYELFDNPPRPTRSSRTSASGSNARPGSAGSRRSWSATARTCRSRSLSGGRSEAGDRRLCRRHRGGGGGRETEVALLDHFTDVESAIRVPDDVRRKAVQQALSHADPLPTIGLAWLPPLLRPGKVLCVALNNSANPERIMSGPSTPAMFVKPALSLVGHSRPIRLRSEDGRVHPELAVVIGRTAADVALEDATSYVFGYTILKDVTAPGLRSEDTFHYRAIHPDPASTDGVRFVESWVSYPAPLQGSDTFGPLGPWVTTADDVPNPHDLRITCAYGGRLVTEDSTANLRFRVAEVIAFASRYLTLGPGDVIGMGTALHPSADTVLYRTST